MAHRNSPGPEIPDRRRRSFHPRAPALPLVMRDFDVPATKAATVSPREDATEAKARQRLLLPEPPFLFIAGTTRLPFRMNPFPRNRSQFPECGLPKSFI